LEASVCPADRSRCFVSQASIRAAAKKSGIASGSGEAPIALKDNIDTLGIPTTGASELFKERLPSADADVVRRLKNAGAVIVLNLHEFAYGGTSAVSYFGRVHNPWALDRVPGGSSGGSAAAVAADLCFGALGSRMDVLVNR
jgi:aspartyl-tRNA(Asn)/glutamyl-tRNA(Gln) amidotransferase subunit A